jgi:hypothetical protein
MIVPRVNAITAMRRMVNEGRCGDFVLFHDSGHGPAAGKQ